METSASAFKDNVPHASATANHVFFIEASPALKIIKSVDHKHDFCMSMSHKVFLDLK
jgi:hypothetical protein